jgi:hypothetical protein
MIIRRVRLGTRLGPMGSLVTGERRTAAVLIHASIAALSAVDSTGISPGH